MQSDQAIIQQALQGNQAAYAALIRRYQNYVYSLVLRIVKKREEAEEVAQDCFLRAFRYLPSYRAEAKFSTWLYRIAYTTALNHIRKNNPTLLSLDDDERPIQVEFSQDENAQNRMEQLEKNELVRSAIQQLAPTDAAVLSLFYLQEQSLEEICQSLNLTMTNAKTKLCRARKRLKPILENTNIQNL